MGERGRERETQSLQIIADASEDVKILPACWSPFEILPLIFASLPTPPPDPGPGEALATCGPPSGQTRGARERERARRPEQRPSN